MKANNTITEPETADDDENKMPSHLKMALHNLLIREEKENCSENQFTNKAACNGNIDITQGFILVRLHTHTVVWKLRKFTVTEIFFVKSTL